MRITTGVLAAVALAGFWYAPPAAAQGVPQGSYLRSCANAHLEGDRLVATCRAVGGRNEYAALPDVRRCVGDIGNNNGQLQCNYGGGAPPPPAYGQAPPPPPPRGGPGFGTYGQAPPPPPGGPGYGGGPNRCEGLHHESRELRDRLATTYDPGERAHLERRLQDVRDEEYRCR